MTGKIKSPVSYCSTARFSMIIKNHLSPFLLQMYLLAIFIASYLSLLCFSLWCMLGLYCSFFLWLILQELENVVHNVPPFLIRIIRHVRKGIFFDHKLIKHSKALASYVKCYCPPRKYKSCIIKMFFLEVALDLGSFASMRTDYVKYSCFPVLLYCLPLQADTLKFLLYSCLRLYMSKSCLY